MNSLRAGNWSTAKSIPSSLYLKRTDHPHFFFNTANNITRFTNLDVKKAQELTQALRNDALFVSFMKIKKEETLLKQRGEFHQRLHLSGWKCGLFNKVSLEYSRSKRPKRNWSSLHCYLLPFWKIALNMSISSQQDCENSSKLEVSLGKTLFFWNPKNQYIPTAFQIARNTHEKREWTDAIPKRRLALLLSLKKHRWKFWIAEPIKEYWVKSLPESRMILNLA